MRPHGARRAGVAIAVLALMVLVGCAPKGANYARPEMAPPTMYRFAGGATQAESIADVPWFQVFDDPALQALIKEAIANNLDLRAAAARVERARALAGIPRSFLYPTIEGRATYNFQQNTNGGNVLQGGEYGVGLSWELDIWGRIRRQTESAVAVFLSTEQARRGVMVTLVGDVASNYFLLRALDAELAIARRTLELNDQTVAYFQNRLDGGVSNRLELDRIQANRAATAAAIPELEQQIAIIENLVSLLAGRPPGAIARETPPPALPPPVPEGMPAALLERRPDVLQAEQLLVAANADIGAARALFFPTISLTGFLGAVSGDVLSLLGREGGVWSVSPGLLQPIFNAGRLRRNVEAAQASFDEGVALYQQSALNAYREVSNSLISIQKLAEVRVQREAGVMALVDASDLARARYDSGLASYIEILTADQELFAEQRRLAVTRGDELRARAELYRALGGGWQQP